MSAASTAGKCNVGCAACSASNCPRMDRPPRRADTHGGRRESRAEAQRTQRCCAYGIRSPVHNLGDDGAGCPDPYISAPLRPCAPARTILCPIPTCADPMFDKTQAGSTFSPIPPPPGGEVARPEGVTEGEVRDVLGGGPLRHAVGMPPPPAGKKSHYRSTPPNPQRRSTRRAYSRWWAGFPPACCSS